MSIKRLLSAGLAFIGAFAFSAAAIGADTPKAADPNVATDGSAGKPPFIVHNPDGTFTVQKVPASGKSEDAKQKGLVIRPQVVVPTARIPERDAANQAN